MSLDRSHAELERPIEGVSDLVAYFRSAEKPRERWRVGTEHEKLGLYLADFSPVPYDTPRGIGALLERIAERDAWKKIEEAGRLIALQKGEASITLEPGGQLELSGAPLRTIHETCDELHAHLALVREISAPLGIVWLGLGLHPFHGIDALPRMPKARYAIMREYLPTRGELALEMMHMTATVQANFDFSDEADCVRKLRAALAVTPIVSAIYANSSLSEGKANGFVSKRIHIWTRTDPDRTGILPWAFDPDCGYARYVEWALDVPLFFIVRDGRYHPAAGRSFRHFLERGLDGFRASLADWDLHLTTLFPEVRLKRFIEVRGADAVPAGLTCSLPALWKGLLYDAEACAAASALTREWGAAIRLSALEAVARHGLAAEVAGQRVLDLARELLAIAVEGLRRLGGAGRGDPDERRYLEPVREQLALGKSPGRVVAERWEGEWGWEPARLIDCARY